MSDVQDRPESEPQITREEAAQIVAEIRELRPKIIELREALEKIRQAILLGSITIPLALAIGAAALLSSRPSVSGNGNGNNMTVEVPADPELESLRKKETLTSRELARLTGEHVDTIYAKKDRGEYQATKGPNGRLVFRNPWR